MLLDMSIWNIISAFSVFLFGFGVAKIISGYFNVRFNRVIYIYLWHSLFCIIYAIYITQHGGDLYFSSEPKNHISFSLGTEAVSYLSYFISHVVGMPFLATTLIFNICGFIGLVAFDSALSSYVHQKKKSIRRLATLIVFLPSISFWSSGIGKDSLAFMSVGLILWAAIDFKKRVNAIIPAIIIMLIVRPHIAGILILAFTFSILIQKNISPLFRIGIGSIAIIASIIILPLGLKYSKIENADLSKIEIKKIEMFINQRASYNMEGGGGVDISKMPLPLQVGTYLFRPLPYEAHNFPSFFASLDNMLLIYLFILGIKNMIKIRYKSMGENRVFLWLYSLSTLLILSTTTANLGISVRQKWMFVPMLIFLMISVIGKRQVPRKSLQ